LRTLAKLLVVIVILNSILVGCTDDNKISNVDENPASTVSDIDDEKFNMNWDIPKSIKNVQLPFTSTNYSANVKPYTINEDLSNIENIQRFSGFTDEQKKMIAKNGFIVLPSRNTKLHYIYESNEYLDIPSFITTDVVLHLYHQFFGKTLIYLESEILSKDLEILTDNMLKKSIALLNRIEDSKLKALQEKNVSYFLVAKMLLSDSENENLTASSRILDLARREYELIKDAAGVSRSFLFENQDIDYSQFTVRGHYTRSERLQNYFRAMMWYGFIPINLMNMETDELYYEDTLRALLIAYTVFMEHDGPNDVNLWSNIYELTDFYVGQSDDITILDLREVLISVFGEDVDVNNLGDFNYKDEIHKEVKRLREPEIIGKFSTKPVNKSFKFMGQRYILDGYIMQELMEPHKRPVPNGLDVMGVLGSKRGEELLFKVYEPHKTWPEYEEKYNKLKLEVGSYKDELWQSNLYNGWIWSIKKQLTEYDKNSGMPTFMTNDSWRSKSLNTALSSYAELKHDTVLYGKQPVAEAGGTIAVADQHYVEPNIELYDTMLWLMKYTVENLKGRNLLNDRFLEGTNSHIKFLELLRTVSIKELNNEPLTEEEKNSLLMVGGVIEGIMNWYIFGSTSEEELYNGAYPIEQSSMIVSDVATLPGEHYLCMGTGYFDEIYVVVPVEGKLYLTRGAVYSYYEFVSDKRLTDEEWWDLHGLKTVKEEDYQYFMFGEPSKQLPEQPFWVNTFKSKTNNVKIEPPEIDWGKLNQ